MSIRALVFDVDGVLVDSEALFARAACETLAMDDIYIKPEEFVKYKTENMENDDVAAIVSFSGACYADADAVFNKLLENSRDGEYIFSGALELLRWLKDSSKFATAIYTGRPRADLEMTYDFSTIVDLIVCLDDVVNPKPHPEGLNLIRRQIIASDYLYIGDTLVDYEAATRAGFKFIGVGDVISRCRGDLGFAIIDEISEMRRVVGE